MKEKPDIFHRYDIRGEAPDEIDTEIVFGVGQALGQLWESGTVVVGRDLRKCSSAFSSALKAGLKSQGLDVVNIGLATTDMVSLKTRKEDYVGGVAVTASHMPPGYGGIKPLNSEGRILHNGEMDELKETYGEIEDSGYGSEVSQDFKEEYIQEIDSRFRELFDGGLEGVKVVVDTGNGMGALVLPDVLEKLGAEVRTLHNRIDPEFPGRDPEPRSDNLGELRDVVKRTGADLGVATDGDADRAVFVDENGDFVSGDESLAILAGKYLEVTDQAVVSINTSEAVEKYIESLGGETIYAPVGAVFTALKCLENGAGFGGQPNGHLMDPEFTPYDSGTLFGAVMAGIVRDRPLSRLREDLPSNSRDRWNVETESKEEKIDEVREKAEEQGWLDRDRYDTLRLETDNGSAVVRPSGSEPLVRVRIESESGKMLEKVRDDVESLGIQKEKR
jgi:phosphomannomutase